MLARQAARTRLAGATAGKTRKWRTPGRKGEEARLSREGRKTATMRAAGPHYRRIAGILPTSRHNVAKASEQEGAVVESKSNAVFVGRVMLVAVAAAYGSLTVALRFLFLSDGPPLPSALSFVRSILVAACFIPVFARGKKARREDAETSTSKDFWRAAFELAVWNFMSQGFQNAGCAFTDAGRASFLTQTAIVFTPLISAARGDAMPPLTIPAVLSAFAGVVLLACGGQSASGGGVSFALNLGDIFCLLGSACYSLYIVRTADYGRKMLQMTGIQAYKSLWLVLLYFGWALFAYIRLPAGSGLITLWPSFALLSGWLVITYSAVVPGALADVFQALGQAQVNATEAQVLLSLEPLFAAVLGLLIIGETMTKIALMGGALIVLSVLLASGAFDSILTRRKEAPAA